jgi:hypothetical protein
MSRRTHPGFWTRTETDSDRHRVTLHELPFGDPREAMWTFHAPSGETWVSAGGDMEDFSEPGRRRMPAHARDAWESIGGGFEGGGRPRRPARRRFI